MKLTEKPVESLIYELKERAKELNCLYNIEEALNERDTTVDAAFKKIVEAIPGGWQHPEITEAKITYREKVYKTKGFVYTPWLLSEPIVVQGMEMGAVIVAYSEDKASKNETPFLKEEIKLLKTIADRLGHFILHQDLKNVFSDLREATAHMNRSAKGEWRIVLDMIRKTDPNLFLSIARKMLHMLCWNGIEEAEELSRESSIAMKSKDGEYDEDENKPKKKMIINNYDDYIEKILSLADKYIYDEEILARVQKWIQEDKSSGLVKALETKDTSLADIADAIRKHYHLAPEKFELSPSTIKGLRVSLLRRFFTEDLNYIRVAKDYVKLTDFYKLIDKMIYTPSSRGTLGGKSSGLFLAASILQKQSEEEELLKNVKIPKTWYVASDGVLSFMQYNNLEEVLEQKYKDIDEVRLEYPHIVQLFKNSQFPPDMLKGISMALDDFGEAPIVVRSSSLLEDQMGASFSGKYKSLFLANQGPKSERLNALTDAIAEVYASTFGPDPIEYRAERGLLDFHEEMGVMIQEVVGNRIGKYFMPSYAGVAFSNNEFRWSPRIKREDGLVRIVLGLGTRAVDRIGDDFPVLITPGQPNLNVNVTTEDIVKYAPKKMDVINLETNQFETITVEEFINAYGAQLPGMNKIFSVYDGHMLRQPMGIAVNQGSGELIVTFEGLRKNSDFVKRMDLILKTIQNCLKTPIDLEFASNGVDLFLLQCRPQSFSKENAGDQIPKDVPKDKIIFSAKKYVSNGKVPEITQIVYVDPQKYSELTSREDFLHVGRAVGKLNQLLPKRKFILMGPGRWGSRGDIKLGVNVTYSDINNTAMLIEIARKKGSYLPDLSFGTHFFQDLVEASIRYLPLYPDDEGIEFNENFLLNSKNVMKNLIPEYSHLSDVVRVIDVPQSTGGKILKVFVNAEIDEAIAILDTPHGEIQIEESHYYVYEEKQASDHWKWRLNMAQRLANDLDMNFYKVKGVYLFGSVKNAVAGPGSDIDLIIHLENKNMLDRLECWLKGWSLALSEINFLRTGYQSSGLLDLYFVTDEDIKNKNNYAGKIGAAIDPARPLKVKN